MNSNSERDGRARAAALGLWGKVGGEADFDEAFGDVGVPDGVAGPDPAAGIFGGRGFFVGVEAGEIHAPEVAFAWREGTIFGFGEPFEAAPGEGEFDGPAAVAVVVFVEGAIEVDGGF